MEKITGYGLQLAEDPQERASIGERVKDLLEHPGWEDLKTGIRAYQDERTLLMTAMPPTDSGAVYADMIGTTKGVAMIERIAVGLIEEGEMAAEQVRQEEDS